MDAADSTVPVNTLAVVTEIKEQAVTPSSRPIPPQPNVEPIIAAMEASARIGAVSFANHLATFAHENQPISLEAGESRLYVFVFDELRRKALPFSVNVRVANEDFRFLYK